LLVREWSPQTAGQHLRQLGRAVAERAAGIAVYYDSDSFSGQMSAVGGGGYVTGGAGTIYAKDSHIPHGELLLSNGGGQGAHTPIESPAAYALKIQSGAKAYPSSALSLTSLRVLGGGLLTHLPEAPGIQVTVAQDALVETGGEISVSEKRLCFGDGDRNRRQS
jgi:hypothetical protein